jgi:hypothetical protein
MDPLELALFSDKYAMIYPERIEAISVEEQKYLVDRFDIEKVTS